MNQDLLRSLTRPAFRSLIALMLSVLLISGLAGCLPGTDSDEAPTADGSASTPATPALTPTGSGGVPTLDSAIAVIREYDDPDDVLGTAVVLESDGLLVAPAATVQGNIELVLPGGQVARPAIVTTNERYGLALLKVPHDRLTPARMSTERFSEGNEVLATGWDEASDGLGRIPGHVTATTETETNEFRVRGASHISTDIALVDAFAGAAVSDDQGALAGVLISRSEDDDGSHAVTNWVLMAWLESYRSSLDDAREQSMEWETLELASDWNVRRPEGWTSDIVTDDDTSFRAELAPGDPDIPLQLDVVFEQNEHGTNAGAFIDEQFGDSSRARVWEVSRHQGRDSVRVSMTQEGALVDAAYVLDDDYLIVISLTSGYRMESDQAQVDQARAIFTAVLESLQQPR